MAVQALLRLTALSGLLLWCTGAPTPVPTSSVGGANCTLNAECGYVPVANNGVKAAELPSNTGSCINGKCQCTDSYGCPACTDLLANAQLPGSTSYVMTTNRYAQGAFAEGRPGAFIDVCVPTGGGVCTADSECLNEGLCLRASGSSTGVCSCLKGYKCPYCEILTGSMQFGAVCPKTGTNTSLGFAQGGGLCTKSSDCHGSKCELGKCKCDTSKGCPDCSGNVPSLVAGTQDCGCEGVDCGGSDHGYCGGNGGCVCHFPWTGPSCKTNPCNPTNNGDICQNKVNAECFIDKVTRKASCECTNSFGKDGNGECTVPPTCATDADCGVWGPVTRTDKGDPYEFCNFNGNKCGAGINNSLVDRVARGNNGGTCDKATGKCTCKPGFTCTTCDAKGDVATNCTDPGAGVTGGGLCSAHSDCNKLGAGNFCLNRRCVCKNGFTCAYCDKVGQNSIGVECPVRSEQAGVMPTPAPTPSRAPTGYPTPRPTVPYGNGLPGLNLGDPDKFASTAGSGAVAVRPGLALAAAGLLAVVLLEH